jgi:phage repressor protein C with HTH and peptisase S24 domain
MTTKERFDLLIKYFAGGNKSEFASKIDVSPTVIENIVGARQGNPSFMVLQKIFFAFAEINPKWLIAGEGEMLKKDDKKSLQPDIKQKNLEKNQNIIKSTEGIPLIPIDAMAGFGTGMQTILEFECERYVVPLFKEAQFLIDVRGSSMQPKYNPGDIVACKKLPLADIFFQWNKVYVLDTEQGALIKRIRKGQDSEHITLVSDNEKYEPFELHFSQINSVALVIGVIRAE